MPDILPIVSLPPPETITTAQVIADEILKMSNDAAQAIVDAHQIPFNKLWKRTLELGVNPQDVLDILGSNGPILFGRASELIQFILGAYGNQPIATLLPSEYTPPYTFDIVNNKIVLSNNL